MHAERCRARTYARTNERYARLNLKVRAEKLQTLALGCAWKRGSLITQRGSTLLWRSGRSLSRCDSPTVSYTGTPFALCLPNSIQYQSARDSPIAPPHRSSDGACSCEAPLYDAELCEWSRSSQKLSPLGPSLEKRLDIGGRGRAEVGWSLSSSVCGDTNDYLNGKPFVRIKMHRDNVPT